MAAVVKCPTCKKQQSAARMTCAHCQTDLSEAASVPFWESYGEGRTDRPPANPPGTDLGLDGIVIFHPDRSHNPTQGVLLESWERFKHYPKELIAIYFFVTILGANLSLNFDSSSDNTTYVLVVLVLLWAFKLAMWALRIPLEAGAATFWLRAWRGQDLELGNVLAGFKYFGRLLVANVLCGAAIALGLGLLIAPGVFLACGLLFVSLLIVDKNLSWIDAIKGSWKLTEGHKLAIFKLLAILVAMNVVASLLCVLPILVTIPVTYGAITLLYNRMAAPGNDYLRHDAPGVVDDQPA